jgi:putative hydrolase of the HAD superfamily
MNGSAEGPAGKEQDEPCGNREGGEEKLTHFPQFTDIPWARIQAVSFDATYTLFEPRDPGRLYAELLREGAPHVDLSELSEKIRQVWRQLASEGPPGQDRFRRFEGGALAFWQELVRRVFSSSGWPMPPRDRVRWLYERFAEPDAWEVFEDVVPSLRRLKARGYRLCVVSNWDERLGRLLVALNLASWFEVVVVSSEVGMEKPAPGIFGLLLDRLGLSGDRVLHVGDSLEEDVMGAYRAGLWAVRLDRSGRARGALGSLDPLVEKLPGIRDR